LLKSVHEQLAAAHPVVVNGSDGEVPAHMTAEVLDELRYLCRRDLYLAIDRMPSLARPDNVYPIRYRRSRSFREKLHKRDSLLSITLWLPYTLIIQQKRAP
jgi:hypothetical protein